MDVQMWTYILVGVTFSIYIGIAIWSRAGSTKEFYVAGGGVSPLANGLATAADWMSAASFLGMAGLISFSGKDGSRFLMGWTGGFVLLALLLAPYLRKYGKFTVPDFVGDRYYSQSARIIAVFVAIFISLTYVAGQMSGVGIVFAKFLNVPKTEGVLIGMAIVFFYAVLGGMKGVTYTQVAQYCVLIFAFMVPALFISFYMTGNPIPMIGFGSELLDEPGVHLLQKLDQLSVEFGFNEYTKGSRNTVDMVFITFSLMVGTAGLPHVIVRFFTVPKVSDARKSALYALSFIGILYLTAPAIAAFARTNLLTTLQDTESYETMPSWFKKWEESQYIAWVDKNDDGKVDYSGPELEDKGYSGTSEAFGPYKGNSKLVFKPEDQRGKHNERLLENPPTDSKNELYFNKDIMVLANPEIANCPAWVIALVAAGGLAAALSTAAGLLLVISTCVSHDLLKSALRPNISEKNELRSARLAAAGAVLIAGYFGINPPGFVAQVVAFAFGLAAASFFPILVLGIFSKRINKQGAIAGMLSGMTITVAYILYFNSDAAGAIKENWWFGISPEGIGSLGMLLNFAVTITVSMLTPPPPMEIQELVEKIRIPNSKI
jgi:cation/acetate symporter